MLIGGCPLEEASEQSFHLGNKSSFLLFLLHDLVYVWYFSSNPGVSVLQNCYIAFQVSFLIRNPFLFIQKGLYLPIIHSFIVDLEVYCSIS